MKQKDLIYLMLIIAQVITSVKGQNRGPSSFKYENGHCIKEVYFSGDIQNYIPIKKDDNSGYFSVPQFVKEYPNECSIGQSGNIIVQNPIAYVSGSKPRVKAKFVSYCSKPFWIRGLGPKIDGNDLIFEKQEVTPTNFEVTYNWKEPNISFPLLEVQYFEKFTIKWQISQNGNDKWIDIGESENPLYVTYKTPETANIIKGYDHFHALLKISCKASEGNSTDNTIISSIWNKIKTKQLEGADNQLPLTYYQTWETCNSTNTKELLLNNDGQCGSWARFFIDLLKIHSINHSSVDDDFYQISPAVGFAHGFFIKNWVSNPGSYYNPQSQFSYLIIPKQSTNYNWWDSIFTIGNKYNFHYSDLKDDLYNIEGQGIISNPESIFGNHQISKINGSLLDSSYGKLYQNLDDFEANSIFGYFFLTDEIWNELEFDPDGDNTPNPTDLNGDGQITSNAVTWVILVSTDKSIANLVRTEGSVTNH